MGAFADRLQQSIIQHCSVLVCGIDPVIETFPRFVIEEFSSTVSDEEFFEAVLTRFYSTVLEAITEEVAAVKPNVAFFEQYGLGGLKAFCNLCRVAREPMIPLIIDGKRGDIGSTAQAYSSAYLGRCSNGRGGFFSALEADALTINPFLGFDTIQPYLDDAREYGKGLYVLVKTSNPGSADIQGGISGTGQPVSDLVAHWIGENSGTLVGECGLSGLGAVVGATHPEEGRRLRRLMPDSMFLIPGFGTQGGSAEDAVAALKSDGTGGVINASRALCGVHSQCQEQNALMYAIRKRARELNAALNRAKEKHRQ